MISKERLTDRIKTAEDQRARLVAELQTLDGVIQDCEYWVGEIDKQSVPVCEFEPDTTG